MSTDVQTPFLGTPLVPSSSPAGGGGGPASPGGGMTPQALEAAARLKQRQPPDFERQSSSNSAPWPQRRPWSAGAASLLAGRAVSDGHTRGPLPYITGSFVVLAASVRRVASAGAANVHAETSPGRIFLGLPFMFGNSIHHAR